MLNSPHIRRVSGHQHRITSVHWFMYSLIDTIIWLLASAGRKTIWTPLNPQNHLNPAGLRGTCAEKWTRKRSFLASRSVFRILIRMTGGANWMLIRLSEPQSILFARFQIRRHFQMHVAGKAHFSSHATGFFYAHCLSIVCSAYRLDWISCIAWYVSCVCVCVVCPRFTSPRLLICTRTMCWQRTRL